MLSAWLSKLKDAKARRLSRGKILRNESPALLARALSLRRANERARSLRPEITADNQSDPHRCSKSINALYILSSLAEGVSPIEAFLSDDFDELGCSSTTDASTDFSKIASSSVSNRMDRDLDLWDGEFSPMSSYPSTELDVLCGQKGRSIPSGSSTPLLKSISRRRNLHIKGVSSQEDVGDFILMLDTDSNSCWEEPKSELDTTVNRNCDHACENKHHNDSGFLDNAGLQNSYSNMPKNKSTDTDISCSIPLPPDLQLIVGNSIALLKLSQDPYEDFRGSMYEMIMEKDLEESENMEELLYCYLRLNSPQLHDLIQEAFSQVWTEILMRVR